MSRRMVFFPAVLLLVLCGAACNLLTGPSNIDYRVSGTATLVSVTYETGGGTSQVTNIPVPWSFSWKADKGDSLYVSAQIVEGDGTVTAAIYKEGDLLKTTTSSGFGSVATVSGTN